MPEHDRNHPAADGVPAPGAGPMATANDATAAEQAPRVARSDMGRDGRLAVGRLIAYALIAVLVFWLYRE